MPGFGRTVFFAVTAGLVFLEGAPWAMAQGITLSASIAPKSISIGAEARLTITVNGKSRSVTGAPDSISVPGLVITYSGQTSRFATVNGRSIRRILLNYSVKAEREGYFVIPSQKIVVDEKELLSPQVRLRVNKGVPAVVDLNPVVKIEIGKREMFVGEVVPISLVVTAPPGAKFNPTDHPTMNPEGFVQKRFAPAVLARAPDGKSFQYRYHSSISAIRSSP